MASRSVYGAGGTAAMTEPLTRAQAMAIRKRVDCEIAHCRANGFDLTGPIVETAALVATCEAMANALKMMTWYQPHADDRERANALLSSWRGDAGG